MMVGPIVWLIAGALIMAFSGQLARLEMRLWRLLRIKDSDPAIFRVLEGTQRGVFVALGAACVYRGIALFLS